MKALRIALFAAVLAVTWVAMQYHANRAPSPDWQALIAAGQNYQVTVYRDDYGVPHIYGKTDAATAFGLAYAHAEDDFATQQEVVLATRGKLAAVKGADAAVTDYLVGLMGVWEAVDAGYDSLKPSTRRIADAYADGYNLYAAQNPDKALPFAVPISGKDVVAGFVFKTPFFYGFDETVGELFDGSEPRQLAVHGEEALTFTAEPQPEVGSQGVAIAPSRSSDGHTRLLVNSHQPLTGPVAWYEARLKSEEGWDMAGATFPGSPLILHGHNAHLGWSNTVNRPDLVDIYQLVTDPDDDNRYRLDGRWHTLEQRNLPVTVSLWRSLRWTFKETLYAAEHGPVLKLPHGVYALRWAGMGEVGAMEQMLALNHARSMAEFETAMTMLAQPSINYVYADAKGNIAHYYNAAFPRRAPGWDWQADLPGDRSDLIWQDYLPFSAVPVTRNPPSGVVFNANNTPFVATVGPGHPAPEVFPDTMGIETRMTNRAYRLQRLLAVSNTISEDQFRAIKYDLAYDEALPAIVAFRGWLAETALRDSSEYQQALSVLGAWDLQTNIHNRSAALAYLTLATRLDHRKTAQQQPLDEELAGAVAYLKRHFGRLDPAWGEFYRHQRGDQQWPIDGGPDVLRAVYGEQAPESGRHINVAGDSYIMFVDWDENGRVSSTSSHSFRSATLDESSVHYDDQVNLFIGMQEKPVYLSLDELMPHVTRQYTPQNPN